MVGTFLIILPLSSVQNISLLSLQYLPSPATSVLLCWISALHYHISLPFLFIILDLCHSLRSRQTPWFAAPNTFPHFPVPMHLLILFPLIRTYFLSTILFKFSLSMAQFKDCGFSKSLFKLSERKLSLSPLPVLIPLTAFYRILLLYIYKSFISNHLSEGENYFVGISGLP